MVQDNFELKQKLTETIDFIRSKTAHQPSIGIILGTGLAQIAEEMEKELVLPYEQIPHFPISTVEFHTGNLIFGRLEGKDVVVMHGRFHYYEGYTLRQIAFPVYVMKKLGVKVLLISNVCGSMNPYFRKGELFLIDDHINMLGDNPLRGPNDIELGPRFPDMSEPYSKRLMALAEESALERKIKLNKGVYIAMIGPSLETRAEYRMMRIMGADVVGMSTVPEAIAGNHAGMEVMGISIITDECYPEALKPLVLEDILKTASDAEPKLTMIIRDVIRKL